MRNIPKFNSRQLFSASEIAACEELTVWQLLEDIMNHYSSKSVERKRNVSVHKTKNDENIGKTNLKMEIQKKKILNKTELEVEVSKISDNLHPDTFHYDIFKNMPNSQSGNVSTHNSNVIAKNLGIPKPRIKIKKTSEIPKLRSTNNNKKSSNVLNADTLCFSSRTEKSKTALSKATPTKQEKSPNLFITFQKSNAQKLKKEIDRYNSVLSGYTSDQSIRNDDYKNKLISELINNAAIDTKESRNFINKTTDSEDKKSEKFNRPIMTEAEKDEQDVKSWLVSIGINEILNVKLSVDEIDEFKDGILFSSIISTLEGRKIPGINPKAKSNNASIKNISKCFEILRAKKVYLSIISM